MSFQGHFVGYGDLESMLEETSHCGDVYADCVFESSAGQPQTGMEYCSTFIQVSRIEGQITHYWRWKVASILLLATGEPFDPEKSSRARIAGDSAWRAVRTWLKGKLTVRVIEAASSMPKNMNHLGGQTPGFLTYVQETAQYSLREVVHQ